MSAASRAMLCRKAPLFCAVNGTGRPNWRLLSENYTTRTFTTTRTETSNEHLEESRSTFRDLKIKPQTHHLLSISHYAHRVNTANATWAPYSHLDVGITISVPVEVVYEYHDTKDTADKTNPTAAPRITVGGVVLHQYLRNLYRSLPVSYHEPHSRGVSNLTKAQVFDRMVEWSEPKMIRGIRSIRNQDNASSKIIQVALAKPGEWDEATHGYGLERLPWYGLKWGPSGAAFRQLREFKPGMLNGDVAFGLIYAPIFPHGLLTAQKVFGHVLSAAIAVWLFT